MEGMFSGKDGTAKLIYILYLVGPFTGGISSIVGVIMAYVNSDGADDWLLTHYRFIIRTFWISLVFSLVMIPLFFLAWLIGPIIYIWLIIRCVKGIKWLDEKQAVPHPVSWMFS